ncbi:type I protein arginine methyltransferase, partial [Phenoliferia sp. Uapishka_3]
MSSCGSSVSSTPSDNTWDDWTEEATPAHSLFDEKVFGTPEQALEYDKAVHGVDLALLAATLDFFERIRLINWIRSTKPDPKTLSRLDRNATWLQDDAFLKPIIQDDPLLQLDFDTLSLSPNAPTGSTSAPQQPSESDLIDALRAQLSDSNQAFQQLKKLYQERVGVAQVGGAEEVVAKGGDDNGKGKERDDDSHYFESYAYNEIHEIMLKDKIRTNSYRDFILSNPSIFKDAVVLDVGCGTGILSMFAAKSGAKKVYAVDASAVAHKAERNIKNNGLSDIITVIKGKVEDIELPEKVDVIVSEWMGYFLLYECMLDSVLHARERFLKPTGLMVPSQCSIMLSLFDGSYLVQDRINFWNDVYGYDMTSMKSEIYDDAMIEIVRGEDVVSDEVSLMDVVTQTVTVPELSFSTPFTLTATRSSPVNAFLGHFDNFFTTDGRLASAKEGKKALKDGEVFFTTSAAGTPTHWKQTLFLLREPITVAEGTVVEGTFRCSKNPENSRELVVEMTWKATGGEVKAQVWKVR